METLYPQQESVVLLLTHGCYWDIYLASRLHSVLWLCLNILWLLVCNPCEKKSLMLLPLSCNSAIDKLNQVSFLTDWGNDLIFSQVKFLSRAVNEYSKFEYVFERRFDCENEYSPQALCLQHDKRRAQRNLLRSHTRTWDWSVLLMAQASESCQ